MDWSTIILSLVSGIATGVISSFAVWWFLTTRLQPKLEICPTLAAFTGGSGHFLTQFRLLNVGNRPAHDISIMVSLRMPSLLHPDVDEWATLETRRLPVLPPGEARRWGIHPERSDMLWNFYGEAFPDDLRRKREEGQRIILSELLAALPNSSIRIAIFGTDAYSKTRHYFERFFPLEGIKRGRFLGSGCEQARDENQASPSESQAQRGGRQA